MDIGQAVERMRNGGNAVRRPAWNGKGMYLFYVRNQGASAEYEIDGKLVEMEESDYVMMKTAGNTFVPWLCSQTDLLANDWEIVPVTELG